jgi:hypothetical protein
MSQGFPALPNIEFLIDGNGEITVGGIGPGPCIATAVDDDASFTRLVRRDGETLKRFFLRLDRAIELALEDQVFIDEVNDGPDERL